MLISLLNREGDTMRILLAEDERSLSRAVVALLEKSKTVAEGAGATPVAACLYGKVDMTKKTVCVDNGGKLKIKKKS